MALQSARTYRDRAAVRDGIAAMIALDDTIRAEIGDLAISGDRDFWEWRCYGRDAVRHGCDLFEFEGGKIKLKQAFRKVVGPSANRHARRRSPKGRRTEAGGTVNDHMLHSVRSGP